MVGDAAAEGVDQSAIDEAVQAARQSDVALLFIALPASVELEGYDRPNIDLTPQQVALIQAVAGANPRTVVILNNGSAIDMRAWIGSVAAVIEAWLPGQAGVGAVLDILFGEVNPSGKLGETFPLRLEDTPGHLNFPGENGQVRYGEGIFVGYRAYEALEREVLFPFGFGLSYTQFEYGHLRVSSPEFRLGETLEISLDVRNTGERAGKEIVQLYVRDVAARLQRPPKELKAFAKLALEVGETKSVTFKLDDRAFSYYDPAYGCWLAEAGEFEILVGSSSADIRLCQSVTLLEGTALPAHLSIESTMGDWLADPQGAELVQPLVSLMFSAEEARSIGMNSTSFFHEQPLTSVLRLRRRDMAASPEQVVTDLLARWASIR